MRVVAATLLASLLVVAGLTVGVGSPAHAAASYRVLVTGDSITQGSSGDYTWRYRLRQKLTSTAPGQVDFVGSRTDLFDDVNSKQGSHYYAVPFSDDQHAAVWGDAFTKELSSIGGEVKASKANVLVVMLGSNDLAYLTSPAETVANLKTYIARARAAKPGIDVVVGEVLTRYDAFSDKVAMGDVTAEYASRVADLAADLSTSSERVVVAHTGDGWNPQTDTWDGTHPNPTGETIIAQNVSEALAKLRIGSASPSIAKTTAWRVKGPKVTVTPASESAKLAWSRTSTGATGMYIEMRLTNIDQAWDRLPYPVSGNGWTAGLLAAGGTYQFRIVPAKYWSTGLPGAATQAVVGRPKPAALTSVTAATDTESIYGGRQVKVNWSASKNATGFVLSSVTYGSGTNHWDDLPYAVDADTRSWTWQPLAPGRYMKFRVKPVRGYLSPGWRNSAVRRLKGVPSDRVYVALGDSYSSGLGSASTSGGYTGGTCYRTHDAWAYKLQSGFQYGLDHLACAGAKTADVTSKQLPSMKTYFAAHPGHPQLVTMTIGGNDVGFTPELTKCIFHSCSGDEAAMKKKVDALKSKLKTLYAAIRKQQPYADVVVGGYPDLLQAGGKSMNGVCLAIVGNERKMINSLAARLNARIASAASAASVWSIGQRARTKFAGHNACDASDPWINAGDFDLGGIGGVAGPNSFHPTDAGQVAYAYVFSDAIIAAAG